MDTVEVLEAARKRVEQGWTQHAMARAADGSPVAAHDESACKFCAMGAIANVVGVPSLAEYHDLDAEDLLAAAITEIAGVDEATTLDTIAEFNDFYVENVSEVLEAFDKAIELAKESD